jgi:Erv1 / Alr family
MKEVLMVALLGALAMSFTSSQGDEKLQQRIGFKPLLFGPPQWRMLHMNALNLPREHSMATSKFERYLFATADVLPCASCRVDFGNVLRRVPVRAFLKNGRAGAIALMFVLHTIVSDRLKKPKQEIFVEEEKLLREYASNVSESDVMSIMEELQYDHKLHKLDNLINKVFNGYKH